MQIIINRCYGGFGFSNALFEWLIKNKGWKCTVTQGEETNKGDCYLYENSKYQSLNGKYYVNEDKHHPRTDPDIIAAIAAIGTANASGELSKLAVVDIPDGTEYEIDEYDGVETVHEAHRSWS